jgi:cytochrome c556
MYKPIAIFSILVFAFGLRGQSSDEQEFRAWMKAIAASAGALRKNLEAKQGEAAAGEAEKLAKVFGDVHGFWEKRKTEDAMKLTKDAQAAFQDVARDAQAGKFEEATADLKRAMGTCGGCHNAHREKTEGGYKIK